MPLLKPALRAFFTLLSSPIIVINARELQNKTTDNL
jgi:hypothetical protein